MNLYYKTYSTDKFKSKSPTAWVDYAIKQLSKLYEHLGCKSGPEIVDDFKPFATYLSLPPKTVIWDYNEMHEYVYYLLEGDLIFYRSISDKDQIIEFESEGAIIVSVDNFINSRPSSEKVMTKNRCRVVRLSIENIRQMMGGANGAVHSQFVLALLNEYLRYRNKLSEVHFLSSNEKINYISKEFPLMLEIFTKKEISQLLGIKPETHSRALKKMKEEKN